MMSNAQSKHLLSEYRKHYLLLSLYLQIHERVGHTPFDIGELLI